MIELNSLIKFLNDSPSSYHTIRNVSEIIRDKLSVSDEIKIGNTIIFTKSTIDGATLVAFRICKEINNPKIKVISSHADSPWFKVNSLDEFNKCNLSLARTEKYGSPILSSWYDRPITLAGRVVYNDESVELIHLKDKTFMIPNLCSHFSRYIEDDSLIKAGNPVLGTKSSVVSLLKETLGEKYNDIKEYSLSFINKEEPIIWGDDNEYLSAPRLDNLASVYTSLVAFINSNDDKAINCLYISDNEEIGSNTDVGAYDEFFKESLVKVCDALGLNYESTIAKSFMISSDNAQGANPYFEYVFNPDYKVYLNNGIVIKNSERYSTTPASQEKMIKICNKANKKCQIYYNRSDIRGGGTIGTIVTSIVPIESVDVGIAQLAMHSSFETIGTKDIADTIELFTYFYNN